MSKGVLASVAALAASAGVAFGQGAPQTAPGAFPTWGGAPAATPPAMTGNAPAGPTNYLPNASPAEMPHNGVVGGGPTYYPGFGTTFDGGPPVTDGMGTGSRQVHGAAGGPDHLWIDVEWLAWRVRSMPIAFPLATAGPAASAGILGVPGTRVLFGQDNVDYGPYFNVLRLKTARAHSRKFGSSMDRRGTSEPANGATGAASPSSPVTRAAALSPSVCSLVSFQRLAAKATRPASAGLNSTGGRNQSVVSML